MRQLFYPIEILFCRNPDSGSENGHLFCQRLNYSNVEKFHESEDGQLCIREMPSILSCKNPNSLAECESDGQSFYPQPRVG